MLRMTKGGKAKQRANGGQPRVARPDAVLVLVFAIIEERTDQRGIDLCDVQVRGFNGHARGRKADQQSQGVSIRRHGMGTGLSLPHESLGEERLERRRERTHTPPPRYRWRRSPASSSNSGAAD